MLPESLDGQCDHRWREHTSPEPPCSIHANDSTNPRSWIKTAHRDLRGHRARLLPIYQTGGEPLLNRYRWSNRQAFTCTASPVRATSSNRISDRTISRKGTLSYAKLTGRIEDAWVESKVFLGSTATAERSPPDLDEPSIVAKIDLR